MLTHRITLIDAIRRAADTYPSRPAIISAEDGRTLTYGALLARCNRLAAALQRRGVASGNKVALMLQNSPEFFESYLAIIGLGAVAVPLNFRLTARELLHILNDSEANAIISETAYLGLLGEILPEAPRVIASLSTGGASCGFEDYQAAISAEDDGSYVEAEVQDHSPCSILYTSGTTSKAKGVIRSHYAVLWVAITSALRLGIGSEATLLAATPLFHIAASECAAFGILAHGGTVVTMAEFDPARFLAAVERYRVTHCMVVPTMTLRLLDSPAFDERDLQSVSMWLSIAGPLAVQARRRLLARMPHAAVINAYGSTEVGIAATHAFSDDDPPTCVGMAGLGTRVAVLDDSGKEVAPGEIGNVAVRGPQLFSGYLKNPQLAGPGFHQGYFLTADIGYTDERGLLYLVGRQGDIIKSGGENVSAREVEETLMQLAGVAEAAVFGVPDPHWGESVVAVVARNRAGDEVDEERVKAHCRAYLAGYKCPRKIIFVESLPRNALGKVNQSALREQYGRL